MAVTGRARAIDLWFVAGAIGLSAAGDFIALIGLVAAAPMLKPDLIFARKTPAIAVMPITQPRRARQKSTKRRKRT